MKAILISIKPKWVAKVLNGEKTIEVRKTCPALFKGWKKNDSLKYGCGIDVYIYCTRDKKSKVFGFADRYPVDFITSDRHRDTGLSGYVVAKFTLNNVEEIKYQRVFEENPFHFLEKESGYGTETLNANEFKRETCLTDKELEDYLNTDKPNKHAYAWHISNLVIFDRPKELSEFYKVSCKGCLFENTQTCHNDINGKYCRITKAPQSMCYIDVE